MTPHELDSLAAIDHVDHEAIAAVTEDDGAIVGVARYVVYEERPRVAEVAFEVVDDLQALGIGTALAHRLVSRAFDNGVATLTATMLWENQPARRLSQRIASRPRGSHGPEVYWELDLDAISERFR